MSLPVMKQMVDRGRLVFSQFAEQLNYKAASAASHPWTALHDHNPPPTDPYKDSPVEQHIHSSSSQTPTMVFLGAPGAGRTAPPALFHSCRSMRSQALFCFYRRYRHFRCQTTDLNCSFESIHRSVACDCCGDRPVPVAVYST
jgi:hypothetical protein